MVNFNLKEPNFETARYIHNNKLLFHLCYLALKDFHIEMYKILKESKNNKDNVFALLKNVLATNEIQKEQAEHNLIELAANKETIEKICIIRDKFYAHLDQDYENYIHKGVQLPDVLNCFIALEKAIITLASISTLQSYLNNIESRDDLKL